MQLNSSLSVNNPIGVPSCPQNTPSPFFCDVGSISYISPCFLFIPCVCYLVFYVSPRVEHMTAVIAVTSPLVAPQVYILDNLLGMSFPDAYLLIYTTRFINMLQQNLIDLFVITHLLLHVYSLFL